MYAKFLLSLLGTLTLLASGAQAQYFGYKSAPLDLAAIKQQPLLVVQEEPDPKEAKRLAKKPEELARYQAYLAACNEQLRQQVPKLWQMSSAVEFKTPAELATLRAAKGAQLLVLRRYSYRATVSAGGYGNWLSPGWVSSEMISALELTRTMGEKDDRVAYTPISWAEPGPVDIIFAVRYLQNRLKTQPTDQTQTRQEAAVERAELGKRLRTKTLLLDETEIKGKLSEQDIKQSYPFPYQLVSRQVIEQAVLNADPRYAYVHLMLAGPGMTAQVAADAADGEVLGIAISTQRVGKGVPAGDVIGKDNLKDFAKAANGKQ